MDDKQMPAFPRNDNAPGHNGMDLRDYFAAKAMQSMCDEVARYNQFTSVSKDAYKMADAMLKARET